MCAGACKLILHWMEESQSDSLDGIKGRNGGDSCVYYARTHKHTQTHTHTRELGVIVVCARDSCVRARVPGGWKLKEHARARAYGQIYDAHVFVHQHICAPARGYDAHQRITHRDAQTEGACARMRAYYARIRAHTRACSFRPDIRRASARMHQDTHVYTRRPVILYCL
jgi:hypothetical protein